jgi:hypothetical protein
LSGSLVDPGFSGTTWLFLRYGSLYIEGFCLSERTAQEGILTKPTVRDLREMALMAISSWFGSAKEGPSSRFFLQG